MRRIAAVLALVCAPIASAPALCEEPAAAGVPSGKLPDTVQPLAYRLDLTIDPTKERFSGRVEIDARLNASVSTIALHGRGLAMHRATATAGGNRLAGQWREVDPTGVALLTFPATLPAGRVILSFEYDAPFNQSPSGLFHTQVGHDWYAWSQFESIDARAAFPGFDEPRFKTPFTVTLRTRPGDMAIGNAPEESSRLEGDYQVHRFEPTLPLPTYLVAMMTGPFVAVTSEAPPGPVRSHALPLRIITTKQNADRLGFALEGTKEIVGRLEDYFGEPFPYPKLDQITAPVMPGAMENAGAALYEDSLLVMDDKSPVVQKRDFGMVVAHELAHQWFGDLVTPVWWDDIWLNESFANWMGYRIGQEWRPELKIGAGAVSEGFAAMNTDALLAGRPIRQPIRTNNDIDAAFDSITYGKGGQVIAMIAAFMGDTKFRNGVRRYLGARHHGNATSQDFFTALAQEAGDPRIVAAMRSFTDQQGVPLLTFQRQGSDYLVRQSRYGQLGTTPPPASWTIPLCTRAGERRKCTLMDGETMELSAEAGELPFPNAGGTGYYRFELSRRDWSKVIETADLLPGSEAQAAADSLLASFRAGRASARQLLDLAAKLVRNPYSYAAAAGSGIIGALAGAELIDQLAIERYRKYVARLYRPIVAETGFDPRRGAYAGEDPELSQRRAQAVARLADTGRDKGLRRHLRQAAEAMLGDDRAALDPAWYDLAFDVFVTDGGMQAARQLLEKALPSQDQEFRLSALNALAASGSTEIAGWLLNDLKDERVRPSEQRYLLRGVISTSRTREVGYRWMREHLGELTEGSDGIFFSARLPQMLGGFCSTSRAEEFARELRPMFAGKPGELELERAIERVRNCAVLRAARMIEVSEEVARLR
ncbi:MAG: M1 family metallopeptidase [Novosphingobium sp.]